jgi:hypothetical protein
MVSFKVNEHQENIAYLQPDLILFLGNLYDFGSRASFGSGNYTPEYAAKVNEYVLASSKTFRR